MKRLAAVALGSMVLTFLVARIVGAQERTFTGLISDEDLNCVQTPMKVPPTNDKNVPAWNKTACVMYWSHNAKANGKYVLYDPDVKATYQLDDQKTVEPYIGDTEKVTITGTLDEGTKTIHIKNIKS
jgi:hypothetical protein